MPLVLWILKWHLFHVRQHIKRIVTYICFAAPVTWNNLPTKSCLCRGRERVILYNSYKIVLALLLGMESEQWWLEQDSSHQKGGRSSNPPLLTSSEISDSLLEFLVCEWGNTQEFLHLNSHESTVKVINVTAKCGIQLCSYVQSEDMRKSLFSCNRNLLSCCHQYYKVKYSRRALKIKWN